MSDYLPLALVLALPVVAVAVLLWLTKRDLKRREAELRKRESALCFVERCDAGLLEETRRRTKARWN